MSTTPDNCVELVVLAHDSGVEQVITTINSAADEGGSLIGGATVVSDALAADELREIASRTRLRMRPGQLVEGQVEIADPGAETSRYYAVVRAGDRLTSALFTTIREDLRKGTQYDLYALQPAGNYLLNAPVANKLAIFIERDVAATWVGSAGFVISTSSLQQCAHYELTSPVAMAGLFLEALLHAGTFRPITDAVSPGSPFEDELTIEPCLYDPRWYHGLNETFDALFATAQSLYSRVPPYFQHAYLYLLQWRLIYNRNSADKMVLRDDLPTFSNAVRSLLASIGDDVIVHTTSTRRLDLRYKLYLLEQKGSADRATFQYYGADISLALDGRPIVSAAATRLDIDAMDLEKTTLRISGRFLFPMDTDSMTLQATYHGKTFQATASQRYSGSRTFGETVYRAYAFDLDISLARTRAGSINFYLVSADGQSTVQLDPRFRRPPSRLTNDKKTYWRRGRFMFYYRSNRIVVARNDEERVRRAEKTYLRSLLLSRRRDAIEAAMLRIAFLATRPYFRGRTIWIYFDKIYKGGDNGEYAYRFARKQRDGIRKYYILRHDVPDANRLRAEKVPFLRFGTLWHKLLFLNADLVFATHINQHNFGGFGQGYERYFRGLLHYKVICIQHGLSVQDLSGTLNRVYDNTKVYCLASPVEAANLSRPEYDYRPTQLVQTGLARYDGLVSDDKRHILIAPTWRNYLAAPYSMGRSRSYNEAFRATDYCRIYNELINDAELLETARATGYRIVLLLHPVTSSQRADFDGNDLVDVVASTGDTNYEKLLSESSLMLTDYSGIQFDFAYLYKPVVYFHPPQLPPSYDEGAYEYDTMSLGEIFTERGPLVASLCEYMRNECALKEKYRARIDDFFTFHDRNNSARIYDVGRANQAAKH